MEARELAALLRDRRLWRGPAFGTLLVLALINVGVYLDRDSLREDRAANLLVNGTDVSSLFSTVPLPQNGAPIRFDLSVGENLDAFWGSIPDARQHPLVILAGMSQNYAINDLQPGDQTIPEWLDDQLAPRGVRAFGLSAPNLSTEEALFLLLATVADPQTRPDTFIYGVCFDKLRNVDLRPGYQHVLNERPELRDLWEQTAQSNHAAHPAATEKMLGTLAGNQADPAAQQSSDQDTETIVRDGLGRWLPIVGLRQELNIRVQKDLFYARNALFNITPSSKRPMLQSRYQTNLDLLALMADVASAQHVQLILYVNPLNPLADNPYIPEEYSAFKVWISDFAATRGIPFANFEDIVPAADWGEFLGGPDFKHFRGEGHRITAEAILDQFASRIPAGSS